LKVIFSDLRASGAHFHLDGCILPSAHVVEQGVDEEHDASHLQAFLDGVPQIVGKGVQQVFVLVPVGRHLHTDGTAYERAGGGDEHPPGPGWKVPQESEIYQAKDCGCNSVLSVIDPRAEPTGFIFDATGKTAYVMIQHGEQAPSLLDVTSDRINGHTDDLIKITGFEVGVR